MRVDLEKTGQIAHGARVTGGVLIGVAALATMVTIVGTSGTLITVLGPTQRTLAVTVSAATCLGLAGVLVPLLGVAGALVLTVRTFRRAAAFELLGRSVLRDGTLDRATFEARLGPRRADATLADAVSRGALVLDAGAAVDPTPSPRTVVSPLAVAETSLAPSMRPPPAHAALPDTRTPGRSVRPPPAQQALPDTRSPGRSVRPPGLAAPDTRSPVVAPRSLPPSEPIADLSGRTIKGTWEIERRLASGGVGTVYVARHARTGRRYALKTLLPDEQLSPNAIARFEREARAATAIGHAGIAAVHDFDVTPEGVHYLVMDLLAGESLETRLARVGRLPWPEARRVILEVGDALAAAHRAGVLHRDVKPSNVFLATHEGSPERAMLVDFGLAKPLRPSVGHFVTRTGAIVGTAHYMAPEQARGEAVDVRTDVYGLGALLYEMLAGVPPFLGSSPFAVMAMLLQEQPTPPSALTPSLGPAIDALVLRALAKDPAARFADVTAMTSAVLAAS